MLHKYVPCVESIPSLLIIGMFNGLGDCLFLSSSHLVHQQGKPLRFLSKLLIFYHRSPVIAHRSSNHLYMSQPQAEKQQRIPLLPHSYFPSHFHDINAI